MYKKRNTNTTTVEIQIKNLDCKYVQEGNTNTKTAEIQLSKIVTMLKTVELPASVPDLAAGLAHVHADTFPLGTGKYVKWICKCM